MKCGKHRTHLMLNFNTKLCQHKLCGKSASFNYPDTCKFLYCTAHRKPDMINLKLKKCHICEKPGHYHSKRKNGVKQKYFCGIHKTKNTVN